MVANNISSSRVIPINMLLAHLSNVLADNFDRELIF